MSTVKKSVELFFQEGNSDKVYHARIVEIAPGKHDVLVAWGRRGASLNQGKKAVGVSLEAAEKTFAKLVREKTGKGYRAMTAAVQPADVAPPEGQGSGSKVTGKRAKVGRAAQLLNAIEEDELQRFLGDDEMIAQQKLDGVRVLVHVHEEIFATNRSGQVTAAGKDLLESFEHLPRGTVVDGEIIAHEGTFTYWLFDLLSIGDEDITSRGYEHRWERLEEEIEPGLVGNVAVLPIVRGKKHKTKLYESLMGAQAEGIVFKHKNAPYVPGRPSSGGSQLKHKFIKSADVVIVENAGNAYRMVVQDGEKTFEVGKVFAGTTNESRKELDARLARNERPVAEVKYLYATDDEQLFQPVFVRIRDDKDGKLCVRSQLTKTNRAVLSRVT